MKCRSMLMVWNAAVSALLALVAASAFADAPPYVRVRNITYAGSGCPAGSVAENISADLQAFTVLFDEYEADTGPGVPFSARRKNCELNVDLDFPQGWSFTIVSVDTRGYVALDPEAIAQQTSSYYFQGQQQNATMNTTMIGPIDQNYQAHDVLGLSALVWSPCGATRSLNMNTQVRTTASDPNANGMITIDSIDGSLALIYGIQWRRCF